MGRLNLSQRIDAEWIAVRSLSRFDQSLLGLTVAAAVLALVEFYADVDGIIGGVTALGRNPATLFRFAWQNGLFIGSGFIALALFFLTGQHTRRTLLDRFQTGDPLYSQTREDALADLRTAATADASRIDSFGAFAAWTDPRANRALLVEPDGLEMLCNEEAWLAYRDGGAGDPDRGKLLQRYVVRSAVAAGRYVFNEAKVRLEDDVAVNGRLRRQVRVRRTDYVSSMMTDALAFARVSSRRDPCDVLTNGVSDFLVRTDEGHRLKPLDATASSNQVGVSVIAFTRDGYAVTVVHSHRANHSADLLAPSGSGSLDWADLAGQTSLVAAARRGARRELDEEIGLDETPCEVAVELLVYAFTRLIHRGGKPEFFALGLIDLRWDEVEKLQVSRFERTFTAGHAKAEGEPIGRGGPLRKELEVFCRRVSSRTASANDGHDNRRRDAVSYQLSHAAALLGEAIADDASWPAIARLLAPLEAEQRPPT